MKKKIQTQRGKTENITIQTQRKNELKIANADLAILEYAFSLGEVPLGEI